MKIGSLKFYKTSYPMLSNLLHKKGKSLLKLSQN